MATSHKENKAEAAEEESYPYQLVRFFTKDQTGKAHIDCVPSTWVTFNIKTGNCECKHIPPPYNDDDFDLLHDFVKNQALPPDSWPSYPITLHGHAKTYDKAMKRLETLETELYAYTTDENSSKADKAAAHTKAYRTKLIKSNPKLIEKLSQVPEIRTSGEDSSSANVSKQNSDVSNDSSTEESQNGSESDSATTHDSNQNLTHTNASKLKNKQNDFDFLSDQDYLMEDPKKSLESSGRKTPSIKSTAKAAAPRSQKKSNSTVVSNVSSESKKGTNAFVPTDAASRFTKRTGASVPPKAPSRSNYKKVADPPVLPETSSRSIDINSNGKKTHLPSEPPVAVRKGPREMDIVSAIDRLQYDVQTMTREFRELKAIIQKSALAQDVFGVNVQSFATEYDITLPMGTLEEFKIFDQRLASEKKFYKEFAATLHFLVDVRSTLSRNITSILKKHLTRELALNFTAVKVSGNKLIFKDTSFCKCMLEVACMKFKTVDKDTAIPITEKIFNKELGNALSNAIDWDGFRKKRPKRRTEIGNAPTDELPDNL